jgi:hypothetical protein
MMQLEALRLLQDTLDALQELSQHPAFADDAPEFNEGGVGYETCRNLREAINAERKGE